MLCIQCEETLNQTGCVKSGVCGKTSEVSDLQDLLIFNLKGIAMLIDKMEVNDIDYEKDYFFILQGLFTTVTNVNFDEQRMFDLINKSIDIKNKYIKILKQSAQNKYEVVNEFYLWVPENRSLKTYLDKTKEIVLPNKLSDTDSLNELLLYGLKGMAAYAYHAYILNYSNHEVKKFIIKTLSYMTNEDKDFDVLLNLVTECGKIGVNVMETLDKANTEHYGEPEPTKVLNGTKQGKSILISGHDLFELEKLLAQTENKNINVYTHGEMLPAHAYPFFKKFSHFIGNYGGAWWEQEKEFAEFKGPIIMTTNCIKKPLESYKSRIFTTDTVAMPGVKHIANHDFTEVINMALNLEEMAENIKGIIDAGFARATLVNSADSIIKMVGEGKIKKFVVMAGCDSNDKERVYYSELASGLSNDSVILTAGCAKYRYNRLNLGDIEGLPRVIDAGQCNDSYSLAVAALKLKEKLNLNDINDLPIYYEIAWYEQKAVIVLLSLLYLGVKNIRLGYRLPAFLSKNVADFLVKNFNIMAVSNVEESLKYINGNR
jgi:hydroxylamine reductase